jgi:hypothetical protein
MRCYRSGSGCSSTGVQRAQQRPQSGLKEWGIGPRPTTSWAGELGLPKALTVLIFSSQSIWNPLRYALPT